MSSLINHQSAIGNQQSSSAQHPAPSPQLFACVFVPHPASTRRTLVDLAREFSPRVEVWHDWLVLLDVGGLGRMIGNVRARGVGLRGPTSERAWRPSASSGRPERVEGRGAGDPAMEEDARTIGLELGRASLRRGWVPRVAVAPTRMAALVMAHARPGLTIVPQGEEARMLAPVPIQALEDLWGLGASTIPSPESRVPSPELFATLRRWGLRTLGELAALPSADLSERLGPDGPALQRIVRGEDPRPLVPVQDPERFEASCDLEWPIEGLEPLSFVLARLFEPLCVRLERADRGAAALAVRLTLTTRDIHERVLQLPAPLRDPRALRTLALLDLESHPPAAGVDRVAIAIEPVQGRVTQYSLIEYPRPSPEQISTLVARLSALMGEGRSGAPALVDTHWPGAFEVAPFEPDRVKERGTRDEERAVGVLRRFRVPILARVAVEDGRPVRVTTARRGLAGGRIDEWAGPWRTSGAWSACGPREARVCESPSARERASTGSARPERVEGRGCRLRCASASLAVAIAEAGGPASSERSEGPWDRDEWDILAADGVVYRIFQDHTRGDRWFIDGIVD